MRFAVAATVQTGFHKFDEMKPVPPEAPVSMQYYWKGTLVQSLPITYQIISIATDLTLVFIEADNAESAMTRFKELCPYNTLVITVRKVEEETIPKKIFLVEEGCGDPEVQGHQIAFKKKEDMKAFIQTKPKTERKFFGFSEVELR